MPERDDDHAVAERVQRPEPDRLELAGHEPDRAETWARRERRCGRRTAGSGVVRAHLDGPAVAVLVAAHVDVLAGVRGLGHARRTPSCS